MTIPFLLVAPLLVPMLSAAVCALFWRRPVVQSWISLAASVALLVVLALLLGQVAGGTILVGQMGNWPAPFGISIVIDIFAAIMLVITGIMAVAVSIYAMGPGRAERDRAGFHPLYHSLLLGVCGSFITGDLFNLYVWFEVMLIASFGLMVLDRTREQLDGGLRYVMLNLIGTTLFLAAIAMLYGLTGTLNMADLARTVPELENRGLVMAVAMLLLVAFGAKAAVFPLFNWLPASYHTASMPVVAIFAALLTKVGVYAILRMYTLLFAEGESWMGPTFTFIAIGTMVIGVLGAAAHYDVRKILSFHIISQIGYMLIGLALLTPLALAGSILYIVHHIVVKANLFLLAGAIRQHGGSYALARLGGLWRTTPLLGLLFLIPALSLAGIPPLSGFWGKFAVIQASLDAQAWLLGGAALAVGLLTLYSMIKIWNEAFWKAEPLPHPKVQWACGERVAMYLPIVSLAAITLTIGLYTEPFARISVDAANQLLNRDLYIMAVLSAADTAAAGTPLTGVAP